MIYALVFNITAGALDGATLANVAIPVADDSTGLIQIPIAGNFGGVDSAMLAPLVGNGGWLLCGIGLTIGGAGAQNVTCGLTGRNAGSVTQRIEGLAPFAAVLPGTQPPYTERPAYVPPFYRFFVSAPGAGVQNHIVRLDIAPCGGDPRRAARAMKITRPLNEFSPNAFP